MSDTKKVLALGSGSVSRPCVQYLLKQGYRVVVVDIDEKSLKRTLNGHPNGTAVVGDAVGNTAGLIREHRPDVVVCLLPTRFMVQTAKTCIDEGVPMVGASYVKEEMRALDASAREKGVAVLCEVGLDPGIDHMSAVATIRSIQAEGGRIDGFWSVCGALPDLGSNTNPMGYKLSWAPASLIGASKRSARIMRDGEQVDLPDGETYQYPSLVEIAGLGWFEAYANADSLPYIEGYGIPEAKSIFRGTLRYPGWCDMITQMQKLRLFDEDEKDLSGYTFASLMRDIVGCNDKTRTVRSAVAEYLGLETYSLAIEKMEWLGLFDDLPVQPQKGSHMDVVSYLYAQKLVFSPGEMDLVAMQHQYEVSYPKTGKRKLIVSTLVDRGSVDEDTSISRTTGMPLGIAAHLILSGAVKGKGVLIPTTEDIYVPALKELEKEGIRFAETETEF